MTATKPFRSIFKIHNLPIMPPVIDAQLREEIKRIREQVREKELKFTELRKARDMEKQQKDEENIAKQNISDSEGVEKRVRLNSYTLSSPIFDSSILPVVSESLPSESDKDTVIEDGPASLQSDISEFTEKSSKDLKNEIDKRSVTPSSSVFDTSVEIRVNNQLKDLIDRQKREYLIAMEALKQKFTDEQENLLENLQANIVTSTPLDTSLMTMATDTDEDFTEFKTCLQSQSHSLEEKTLVNNEDIKLKAVTTIQAHTRGFLTRRLMKTIYVQEQIRNIKETLHLVLRYNDEHEHKLSPVQNLMHKAKLFRQLQSDLYCFSDTFFKTSSTEKTRIISSDREIRHRKKNDDAIGDLSLSFQSVV